MTPIDIASVRLTRARARVPYSAYRDDQASPSTSPLDVRADIHAALGALLPAGTPPWSKARQDDAWRKATLAIGQQQDDAHFAHALDALTRAMGMELAVDKAEIPLAALACALTCPDSSARSNRVRLVLERSSLWTSYPQSDHPTTCAFREAAITQLIAPLLKTSCARGCSVELLTPASTLLAGFQDPLAWARIGESAGGRMKGHSEGSPWSRLSKTALHALPSPFWISAQRRLSSNSVCWRIINDALHERSVAEPLLGPSLWGSALLAFSPTEVERCETQFPGVSQEVCHQQVADHLDRFHWALSEFAWHVQSASSRASSYALKAGWPAFEQHKSNLVHGSPVWDWVRTLPTPEVLQFLSQFQTGCHIQRGEHDIRQSRRSAVIAQYNAQQDASDARVAALLTGGSISDLDPTPNKVGMPERIIRPWPRNPNDIPTEPGGWGSVIDTLASASNSTSESDTLLSSPVRPVPTFSAFSPKAPLINPQLLELDSGHWLHPDRSDSERARHTERLNSFSDFSAHVQAQAYAMRLRPPSTSTDKAAASPRSFPLTS